jgi:uncharacterized membrane protein
MTKEKVKSTVFWAGFASGLVLLIQALAILVGFEIPKETAGNFLNFINSLLALLTFSGILVNPQQVQSFQVMVAKVKK